jgi:hypothetical protein
VSPRREDQGAAPAVCLRRARPVAAALGVAATVACWGGIAPSPAGAQVSCDAAVAQALVLPAPLPRLQALGPACPGHPGLLRELTGLHFQEGETLQALETAEALARAAPDDPRSWALLAPLRYLADDRVGALAAWNRVGRPRIVGLTGTVEERGGDGPEALARAPGQARALSGLEAGRLLTPGALEGARLGLQALPAVERARVDYRVEAGGGARVEAHTLARTGPGLGRLELPGHLARGVTGTLALGRTRGEARRELSALWTSPARGASLHHRTPALGLPEVGARLQLQELRGGELGEERRGGVRLEAVHWPQALAESSTHARSRVWVALESTRRLGPGPLPGGGAGPGDGAERIARRELGGGVSLALEHGAGPEPRRGGVAGVTLAVEGWTPVGGGVGGGGVGRGEAGAFLGWHGQGWSLGSRLGGVGIAAASRDGILLHLRPRFGGGEGATHLLRGSGGGAFALASPGVRRAGWVTAGVEVVRWARPAQGPGLRRWLRPGVALLADGARGVGGGGVPGGAPEAGGPADRPGWRVDPGVGVRLELPGAEGALAADLARAPGGGARLSVGWRSRELGGAGR